MFQSSWKLLLNHFIRWNLLLNWSLFFGQKAEEKQNHDFTKRNELTSCFVSPTQLPINGDLKTWNIHINTTSTALNVSFYVKKKQKQNQNTDLLHLRVKWSKIWLLANRLTQTWLLLAIAGFCNEVICCVVLSEESVDCLLYLSSSQVKGQIRAVHRGEGWRGVTWWQERRKRKAAGK